MTGGPKSDTATPSENGRRTNPLADSSGPWSLGVRGEQPAPQAEGREGSGFHSSSNQKGELLPALVDIGAVAQALSISMRQVRRFVADGQMPFVRVGHLIRFDPDELNDWINARRAGSTQSF